MSRQYKLNDPIGPGLTLTVHNDKDCIFCKHCDVFWDYTNGPYLLVCDEGRAECGEAKTSEEHIKFKENNYEKEY